MVGCVVVFDLSGWIYFVLVGYFVVFDLIGWVYFVFYIFLFSCFGWIFVVFDLIGWIYFVFLLSLDIFLCCCVLFRVCVCACFVCCLFLE